MKPDNFADRLCAAVHEKDSRVCVGLDPNLERMPRHLLSASTPGETVERFCCEIIDAVAEHCVAVKPQAAYFEVLREEASTVLWSVMRHAKQAGLLVILDGKRNDIGSTAQAYAQAYLRGDSPVDAMTVNRDLGGDGVMPFVRAAAEEGRGLFVLVKTSNPSSGELQDLRIAETRAPVYQHIADLAGGWGRELVGEQGYSSVGAVVGATYPEQLAELRERMPQAPFLVPGYGAQGATAADVVAAFDSQGLGAVVNSSRGIIFAYKNTDMPPDQFATATRAATVQMKDELNKAITEKKS